MDEQTKVRMNLVAIQKVDPYAKEILDSCPHVAFYKYISNEWQKSEIEGSFFVYSRVAEPFHSIFINNRLNTNSLVEPISKPIELQNQPPFLLCRNQRQAISGFWFYCKEDCVRIHGLLERLIKKCNNNSATNHINNGKLDQIVTSQQPQQQQQSVNIHQIESNKQREVDIFSMLSKAQADFKNTNTNGPAQGNMEQQFAEMKINSQQQQQQFNPQTLPNQPQHQHQPLMKQLSNAMPDITSPNVVSFFAAAQQPVTNGVVMDSLKKIHGAPHHFTQGPPPSLNQHKIVQPPVQTLDEIEKQHRVSSMSPKINEPKLLNNLLQSAAANQHQQTLKLLQQPSLSSQQQQPTKPTLITPTMFQASNFEQSPSMANRPEPLTQNQLIQALNYLLENDPEFIQKIHEAYIKSFKMVSL